MLQQASSSSSLVATAATTAAIPSAAATNIIRMKVTVPDGVSFTGALIRSSELSLDQIVDVLLAHHPADIDDFSEQLHKMAYLLHENHVNAAQQSLLQQKLDSLALQIPRFANTVQPTRSRLYLLIEHSFDVLISLATDTDVPGMAPQVPAGSIRFLADVFTWLNYWEIFSLVQSNPSISKFLLLIKFDMHDCYVRFMRDYRKYAYHQRTLPLHTLTKYLHLHNKLTSKEPPETPISEMENPMEDKSPLYHMNKELSHDHDKFLTSQLAAQEKEKPIPRERRKMKVDSKLAAHRIIKKPDLKSTTARSSNYDPDVVHECQLSSPDEPGKLCLRRFSRKYELIRHQETVHSKKKKLFKCFVCVKQDPAIGPRIFTRHDTLAKHIRVNHRISGKEAKAEVAYSKKHAEIVEEGDITVHVGRRKTKVDFELRAHMDKKGSAREGPDGSIIFDDIIDSGPEAIDSGDEGN